MPSLRARLLSAFIKAFVRRRRWGRDERAVARRARVLFGAPKLFQQLRTVGLRVERVEEAGVVRGEWVVSGDAGAGVILYFHGGGFVSCSPAMHRPITAALARLTSSRVFAPDYRLAPEHRYPAALDDALSAYRWLLAGGLPAESIAFAGDSAGGGLVLSALLRARDAALPMPACAVCFSPWADLAGTGASVRENDGRCAMFRTPNIAEFAAAYLGDASPLDPYASPAHAADFSGFPPLLFQVGSTELLLDDSARVHRKILDAGGDSRLEVYENLAHCWQLLDGLVPEARTALRSAADFIRAHTATRAPDAMTADVHAISPAAAVRLSRQ